MQLCTQGGKNNLNLRIKTEPVTIGADTVQEYMSGFICVPKSYTYTVVSISLHPLHGRNSFGFFVESQIIFLLSALTYRLYSYAHSESYEIATLAICCTARNMRCSYENSNARTLLER